MKVVLMVIFAVSYALSMLRVVMDKVDAGAAILNSVAIIVNAAGMMILFYVG